MPLVWLISNPGDAEPTVVAVDETEAALQEAINPLQPEGRPGCWRASSPATPSIPCGRPSDPDSPTGQCRRHHTETQEDM